MIPCVEIINAENSASANKPTNVTSATFINYSNKTVGYKMNCYIAIYGHIAI